MDMLWKEHNTMSMGQPFIFLSFMKVGPEHGRNYAFAIFVIFISLLLFKVAWTGIRKGP